jgi:O-antigen/teichoic acid export membrane protein
VVGYASAGLALGALAYAAILLAVGPAVMTWLYNGRYDDLAQLLPIVAVIPLLGVGASVLAPALRALERPDLVFVAYAASTVSSLTVGMVLMVRFGVAGAAGGLVISTAVTTVILGWKLVTTRSRRSGHAPGGRSADASSGTVSGSSTIANSASE